MHRPLVAARWATGLVLLVSLLTPAPAPAAGAGDVTPAPTAEPTDATGIPLLWLSGPFGRVAGGSLEAPSATPPGGQPLDAWTRGAPLRIESDASGAYLLSLTVRAQSLSDPGAWESLSGGSPTFAGPSSPGRYRVVAESRTAGGALARWAWLVEVPDREPPADGILDIPAPDVVVFSTAGELAGRLGSGCYLYLCVEGGPPPPPGTLGALAAAPGEVLRMRLSDGSLAVAWKARLTPLDGTPGRSSEARAVLTDTPEATLELVGLQQTTAGRWLLDLEVELDRDRGWLRSFYVLGVGSGPPDRTSPPASWPPTGLD